VTTCILIYENEDEAKGHYKKLLESEIRVIDSFLIKPSSSTESSKSDAIVKQNNIYKILGFSEVRFLNPKLDRQIRNRTMRLWLSPFGFISGVVFVKMTNLTTFSRFGFNQWGELLMGGFLGMISGLIGSFIASGSINTNRHKEIRELVAMNKDNKWMWIVETPFGIDFPWYLFNDPKPFDSIVLKD
tara:strand:+ start:475 stop:1035 length:561 start_codon:yes stop_codon:yes gene_type:complete